MNFWRLFKFLYVHKNGECRHEALWKTEDGYCYVCPGEIQIERMKRFLELFGAIERIKEGEGK